MIWLGKKQYPVNPLIKLGDGLVHQVSPVSSIYYHALTAEEITAAAEQIFSARPVHPITITNSEGANYWEAMLDTDNTASAATVQVERPATYETYFGTFSFPHE